MFGKIPFADFSRLKGKTAQNHQPYYYLLITSGIYNTVEYICAEYCSKYQISKILLKKG